MERTETGAFRKEAVSAVAIHFMSATNESKILADRYVSDIQFLPHVSQTDVLITKKDLAMFGVSKQWSKDIIVWKRTPALFVV